MKRNLLTFLLAISSFAPLSAQWQWHNPQNAPYPVIQNQGFGEELKGSYTRLPQRAEAKVCKGVWDLSRHSSGLAIRFTTNAPEIQIRHQTVSNNYGMSHMAATGVSGVDLYRKNSRGSWEFCFDGYAFRDTITYSFKHLIAQQGGSEYCLYLSLYNTVKWLEIGVPDGYSFSFIPTSTQQPIVLYGTSIAQGACASRPGMAWGNILQRHLECPVLNFGFSGNGRLEPEVIDLLNETESPRLFILDCIPNMTHMKPDTITPIVVRAVHQIRAKHPDTPILLVEHAGYSNALTDSTRLDKYDLPNKASRKAYLQLKEEGVSGLSYISHDELAFPGDAWVDYVHPSDLGMVRQEQQVEKVVRRILNLPQGTFANESVKK